MWSPPEASAVSLEMPFSPCPVFFLFFSSSSEYLALKGGAISTHVTTTDPVSCPWTFPRFSVLSSEGLGLHEKLVLFRSWLLNPKFRPNQCFDEKNSSGGLVTLKIGLRPCLAKYFKFIGLWEMLRATISPTVNQTLTWPVFFGAHACAICWITRKLYLWMDISQKYGLVLGKHVRQFHWLLSSICFQDGATVSQIVEVVWRVFQLPDSGSWLTGPVFSTCLPDSAHCPGNVEAFVWSTVLSQSSFPILKFCLPRVFFADEFASSWWEDFGMLLKTFPAVYWAVFWWGLDSTSFPCVVRQPWKGDDSVIMF